MHQRGLEPGKTEGKGQLEICDAVQFNIEEHFPWAQPGTEGNCERGGSSAPLLATHTMCRDYRDLQSCWQSSIPFLSGSGRSSEPLQE